MKIEVLVATMNNNHIEELVKNMNLKTDAVVVNQCDCQNETTKYLKIDNKNIKLINSPERGLSRSRNKALENVSSDTDIIIFSDDDIKFSSDYETKIIESYQENDCDGIVFNVRRVDGSLNKKLTKKINQINLFRVCSVSLTFKYKKISSFKFDENFGTGSNRFVLGEENIFLSDCLKNNLNIISNNYIMCEIENRRNSTWYKGIDDEFLISKGASFKRMHKYLYILFILDFAIRKYAKYKNEVSFFEGIKYLCIGSKKI